MHLRHTEEAHGLPELLSRRSEDGERLGERRQSLLAATGRRQRDGERVQAVAETEPGPQFAVDRQGPLRRGHGGGDVPELDLGA